MTTRVKICGITDAAAMQAALEGGADFVGLVFFPKSPRHLDLTTARGLRDIAARHGAAKTVALVVDADEAQLEAIAQTVDPDFFQLHGHETAARVAEIRARFGRPLLKAVPVASAAEAEAGLSYLAPGRLADLVLFDAKPDPAAALPGGNGLAFDWHLLDRVKGRAPFMLAGGLTPDNVALAIARTGAAAVDVSSGVETAPGVKSPELIRRFLQAAKGANQRP